MNHHNPFKLNARALSCTAAVAAALLWASLATAQEVRDLQPGGPRPAPLGGSGAETFEDVRPVDLGQVETSTARQSAAPATAGAAPTGVRPPGTATRAALAAGGGQRPGFAKTAAAAGATPVAGSRQIERAVFNRQPVRAALAVGRERLITLPSPVVLHVPDDMATIARIESIDKTLYVTALTAFTPVRVVAELIDGGQQIPIDLVANAGTAAAAPELEIHLAATDGAAGGAQDAAPGEALPPAPDMVALTRFAARQLYAPRRLAYGLDGVQQVEVTSDPQPALMRGVNVRSVPLAQWRAGKLYVTAVQVTNQGKRPVELPTDDLRGHWVAVTAQHGRLGPAGTETDTTALYLVCDRPFEACR